MELAVDFFIGLFDQLKILVVLLNFMLAGKEKYLKRYLVNLAIGW